MNTEHPFAAYIRILGKGKRGSRSLTRQEARDAMKMILADEVEECQLGAFLMLLRVKEETPEEVAGFVDAIRAHCMDDATTEETADLDWSSYAGKRRQLPWFILAALLLAENGIRILMHGAEGHTAGRLYTRDALTALGLPIATSLSEARQQISHSHFAYLPLQAISPKLHDIIQMRPLLGLRSPVHTIARMLNPLNARYVLQGIFHPPYRDRHQRAAQLLEYPHLGVLKGEGGEIERNPDQACLLKTVHNGSLGEEEWPALFQGRRHLKDEDMDVSRLHRVWQGSDEDEYAIAAITGTAAIALKLLDRAPNVAQAQALANTLWQKRNRQRFEHAA